MTPWHPLVMTVALALLPAEAVRAQAFSCQFDARVQVGTIAAGESPFLNEASGLVQSRTEPEVFWSHQDNGGDERIFALRRDGTYLGTWDLAVAAARDPEDIAIGPGPVAGVDYVYFGDVGHNNGIWGCTSGTCQERDLKVWRAVEPNVDPNQAFVTVSNYPADTITLRFPDAYMLDQRQDVETLMVDPLTGDILVATKRSTPGMVFRAPYPQSTSEPITMEWVADLPWGGDSQATGGDISADGRFIIIRRYGDAFIWERPPGATVAQALNGPYCHITGVGETQGEAVAFDIGNSGTFYTTSEGGGSVPIYRYRDVNDGCSNDGDCDDGDFCNGAEFCGAGNTCQSGAPPSCAGQVCSESLDQCVDCVTDGDCAPQETCDAAAGVCLTPPAPEPLPIDPGDTWRYFKGVLDPPPDWNTVGFDDSGWDAGPGGFGFGADCVSGRGTTLDDMQGNYASVFLRKSFDVANPSEIAGLTLTVDYDDGFVAYLNGQEVARSNVVGVPPVSSQLATANHECSDGSPDANPPQILELSAAPLASGLNVLAIQGHNLTLSSSDFTLTASLAANLVGPCLGDSDGDGVGDACDPCPGDPDNDLDADGVCGDMDGYPNDPDRTGPPWVGTAVVNHIWQTVSLPYVYQNPVVIAGPPSLNGGDPGVAQLQGIGPSAFDIRYAEWEYLDGVHGKQESIPWLVLEKGRYTMDDGSIWEVGSFSLSGTQSWIFKRFSQPFAGNPQVFLSPQTAAGEPVTVRARNVKFDGFGVALFEEEALMDGHPSEKVGYLAIYSPGGSGEVTVGGALTPYLLQTARVDRRFVPFLGFNVKLEEERSADEETWHQDETVALFGLGGRLWAQGASWEGIETFSLRRIDPVSSSVAAEWGTVDDVDGDWSLVPLAKSYVDPIIVVKPASNVDSAPGSLRVRNIDGDSFEVRFEEWSYLDGTHLGERIFYIVAEAGHHDLGGLAVQAGKLDTDQVLGSGGWTQVVFATAFAAPPAVFASLQTVHEADPVVTRVRQGSTTGFEIIMQEEEASGNGHAMETVGWIAVDAGLAVVEGRKLQVLMTGTDDHAHRFTFAQPFGRRFPIMVTDVASANDGDTCSPRFLSLFHNRATVMVQEEQSSDAETDHAVEEMSVFLAE